MWNYVAFQDHLNRTQQSEYNGNELYIYQMIKNDDIGWFPINRFLYIKFFLIKLISSKLLNINQNIYNKLLVRLGLKKMKKKSMKIFRHFKSYKDKYK
jgi:hypothetical protein